MKNLKLIGPIKQLLTLDGLPIKGALQDDQLEIIENAGILIKEGKILEVGKFETLCQKTNSNTTQHIELEGDFVALPGFIDCHTHICFSGSRARDFALRNSGVSYLQIAKTGGGIWDTVTQTRKTPQSKLARLTADRANRHLSEGVTTIEVKSGYGLSIPEEIKMLGSIISAQQKTKADLIPTCLAAHTLPRDFEGDREAYLEELSTKLLPILKKEKLTNRIDAFIEKGAFSAEEIEPYFQKAKSMGFDITVHADQFSRGGSAVAVKFGAKSADHLEVSGRNEIKLLANSDVVAVALPGASIGLGVSFTPARKILDQGGALAIASDWNPGSAPMGDLLAQASILATMQNLSTVEVFAAITFRAAEALGLQDRGKIKAGLLADFSLFPGSDFREILYNQGKLKPAQVWKNGLMASRNKLK